jgi:hypothetical protein
MGLGFYERHRGLPEPGRPQLQHISQSNSAQVCSKLPSRGKHGDWIHFYGGPGLHVLARPWAATMDKTLNSHLGWLAGIKYD